MDLSAPDHESLLAESDQKKAQRDQASQNAATQSPIAAALSPPKFGFERYLEQQLANAGGQTMSGSDNKAGFVYPSGPFKGMNQAQATEKIRAQYGALPDNERAQFESQAHLNDVRSGRDQNRAQTHDNARAEVMGLTDPRSTGRAFTTENPVTPPDPSPSVHGGNATLAQGGSPPPKIGNGQSGLDYLRSGVGSIRQEESPGARAVNARKKQMQAVAPKRMDRPPGASVEMPTNREDVTMNTYGLSLPSQFS